MVVGVDKDVGLPFSLRECEEGRGPSLDGLKKSWIWGASVAKFIRGRGKLSFQLINA